MTSEENFLKLFNCLEELNITLDDLIVVIFAFLEENKIDNFDKTLTNNKTNCTYQAIIKKL